MLITVYPVMGALAWALLALAFAIPIRNCLVIWRERPMVIWDSDQQRWRSARSIRWDRERR